jgi:hypothetical protein
VLSTLKNDLVARGKISANEEIEPIELAMLLIKEYVRYPGIVPQLTPSTPMIVFHEIFLLFLA